MHGHLCRGCSVPSCPPGAWAPPKSACGFPEADPQPTVAPTAFHSVHASLLSALFEALSQQQEVSAGLGAPPHSPKGPGRSPWPVVTLQTVSHCKAPPDCIKWKRARWMTISRGCCSQPWAEMCERHLMQQLLGITPCI